MPKNAFEIFLSKWLFSDFVSKIESLIPRNLVNGAQLGIPQKNRLSLLYLHVDGIWAPCTRKAAFGLWKNVFSSIFDR